METTNQAVTQEQAAELLRLWQTMQVLSSSDTAAQQEKAALVEQIQETMTAGQMQVITEMNLSRADMMTVMQEQGPGTGGPTNGQNSTAQNGNLPNNSGRNFGPGGDMVPTPLLNAVIEYCRKRQRPRLSPNETHNFFTFPQHYLDNPRLYLFAIGLNLSRHCTLGCWRSISRSDKLHLDILNKGSFYVENNHGRGR